MSMNRSSTITAVALSGAVTVMIASSFPTLARGGGHHHGECGEHGYGCGYFEHEAHHHRGHHGRHFEDHDHSGSRRGVDDLGYQTGSDRPAPESSGPAPRSDQR